MLFSTETMTAVFRLFLLLCFLLVALFSTSYLLRKRHTGQSRQQKMGMTQEGWIRL